MIANDGTLSTHTAADDGNLDDSGAYTMESEVVLPEGSFTIIAHARFFVDGIQYDVAKAIKRLVKSEDAVGRARLSLRGIPYTYSMAYVSLARPLSLW